MKPRRTKSTVPRHITPEQDRHIRRRTRVLCLTMAVVCFGTLLWRLFVLQVQDPDGYAARAADQQLRDTVIPAPRGEIYSADGTLLAASETRWTIRASPRDLADALVQPAAQALSEILEIDYEETLEAFSNRNSNDCLLKRRVDKATADAVRTWCAEQGAEGIQIRQDTKRIYPEGNFMGVLLGFTDVDNAGLWGLELEYDTLLTGTNGRVLTAKDAWGYDMPQNYSTLVEPVPGASLTLTIDANIQRYLESALSAAVSEHHVASRGVGIVMDVETGAILAMTVKPDYDPNDPRTIVNEEIRNAVNALEGEERSAALQTAQQAQWRNKAISDLYEPGSVFKLITAAAALDTGACTPDSQFVCAGSINVAGTRFRCANGHIHGLETFAQGLAVSCNPCFIQIGARLGKEAFCDYFAAFGLREATGIDLPGEIKQSEYYTADRMGPVQNFGPCLFYIITMYFAMKKQEATAAARRMPCFAATESHAAVQKLLRNALLRQLGKLQQESKNLSQQKQLKIHHSITAQKAAGQPAEVGGWSDVQKLDAPVQQHDQAKQQINTPVASDQKMPEQGNQLTKIDSRTTGTDRKLVSIPEKTPFRKLMTTQLFPQIPKPQPHQESFREADSSDRIAWAAS